jgi:hypothetical protein
MKKKIPKILSHELKYHDFGTGMNALMDWSAGESARSIVRRLKRRKGRPKPGWHYGDPCRFCGVAHDDVSVGDCSGNPP